MLGKNDVMQTVVYTVHYTIINGPCLNFEGSWTEVSAGGGLNQYHPFIPHARSLHAGAPINTSTFAIFGGCARSAFSPSPHYYKLHSYSGGQVGGPCPLQDSWLFDLDSAEWTSFSICPLSAVRPNMAAVSTFYVTKIV